MVNIARRIFGFDKPETKEDQEIIQRLDELEKKLKSSEEE
tara:strand:- start:471 stop:590 length:120 start_codon:yes stop_codon:yes gene_type:complete